MYEPDNNTAKSNGSLILIAAFNSVVDARECKETITSLFDQIKLAVNRVFSESDGQAALEQIAAIYEEYGLTNDNGWEQALPLFQRENEVIWPLPEGVISMEAEDLIATMEPFGIEFHHVKQQQEPWQMFPIPELVGDPESLTDPAADEHGADDEFSMLASLQQKRILH